MPRYTSSSSAVGVLDSTATPELDWSLLYDLHADRLRRIIHRKVGPAHTEDVLQETFLRAYRNRHTLDPERPIAPWLITIALRAAADNQRRQLRRVDSDVAEEAWEETGFGEVEEELVRRAKRLGIKHALASLTTRQRRMLEAVAVNGVPYHELAMSEDMSPDAVRCVVARARTNFRASYTGFTRSSGLFGGAVGTVVLRLRLRLQRYQDFVGQHATAFGAATVTVVAVGIASFPVGRPVATEAAEVAIPSHVVAGALAVPVNALQAGDVRVDAAGVQDPGTWPKQGPSTSAAAPADALPIGATVDISSHGDDKSATFEAEITAPATDRRTWGSYSVDCDVSPTGPVECFAIDTLAKTAPGGS